MAGTLEAWIPERARFAVVVGWALLVHGVFLFALPLTQAPTSLFFAGDSVAYLREAHRIAAGLAREVGNLPYHAPLTSWLAVPLWKLWARPEVVSVGSKILMALLSGLSYGLFFRLIRPRIASAFLLCLFLPLSFGELVLASAINSEVVYRLLLVWILALGWRNPWISGILNGLAALARPEHLPFAILLAVGLGATRARRPFALKASVAAVLVLVPHVVTTASILRTYNRTFTAELAQPLPVWVPISFYGPLNFAVAQTSSDLHFSLADLPPSPRGADILDPTFRPHNELIVNGYGIGWAAIARHPLDALQRAVAKVGASLGAVAFGWTAWDLPLAGPWVRQPVDVARSPGGWLVALCLALALWGGWTLRGDRLLLGVGLSLLLYRLAMNAVFFPYLRGVLIVGPFLVLLIFVAMRDLASRARCPRWAGAAVLGLFAVLHLAALIGPRFQRSGETDAGGQLLDDRRVELRRSSIHGVP